MTQAELFHALGGIVGRKTLVLDRSLSGLVSSLASFSQLQEHGVDSVRWLETGVALEAQRVAVILRPLAATIARAVALVQANRHRRITLLLVPQVTHAVRQELEGAGIAGDVDVRALPVRALQDDIDFYRLDLPPATAESAVVPAVEIDWQAEVLIDLQRRRGAFSRIRGMGENAVRLADVLGQRQPAELEVDQLGELIILDRQVDTVTPFVTQLTYEGMLHEDYSVSGNVLELPASVANEERKLTLGPADTVFVDLRSENLARVGSKLSGRATSLSTEYDARHSARTTQELKAFVSRIPNLQSSERILKVHIELAEQLLARAKSDDFRSVLALEQSLYSNASEAEIAAALEHLLARQIPVERALRLLCMWSAVHNGLKAKDHEAISLKFVHAYGHRHQLTLHRLRRRGLFIVRTPETERARGGWSGFSRAWKLVDDAVDEQKQEDLSYLYSGYVPLSLRLLESYLSDDRRVGGGGSTGTAAGVTGAIGGLSLNSVGLGGGAGGKLNHPTIDRQLDGVPGGETVVCALGALTAAELAGVRFLATRHNRKLLVVCAGLTTGSDLVRTYLD